MITSFEVAAIFSIEDDGTETLAALAAGMERVAELATEARASLQALASVTFGALSSSIDALAGSIGSLNRVAAEVAKSVEGVSTAAGTSAEAAVGKIDAITAAYERAQGAEERYRAAAARPYEISGPSPRSYEGEIGGTDMVRYGGPYGMTPFRRPPGPVIDGEVARDQALALGYSGTPDIGFDPRDVENGGGVMVMPRGFGRGNASGGIPYQGGYRNPYSGAESGPAIPLGEGDAPRPHDPDLDIPPPPGGYGSGRGGRGSGGAGGAAAGAGGGRRDENGIIHFGLAELAADWAIGDAFKTAAEEQNAIVRTEIGLQLDPNSAEGKRVADELRATYRQAAAGTQFSEKNTAVAGAIYARELGFTAKEGGVAKFQQSFPVALRSAEIAEQEGLGTLDGSLTASLEYAHMTGNYEPKALEHSLNVLQQVATLTDNTMSGEESILKYSVPVGRAAGINPDKVAEMTGFLQQSGFNSSTAGTGLSHIFLGALQSGGGINSHLEKGRSHAEQELIASLHLSPEDAAKSRKESRDSLHVSAAKDLHIIDDKGNSTILTKDGGLDVDALYKRINDYGATHTPFQTLETMQHVFGLQGGRPAAVIGEKGALERAERFNSNVEAGAKDFGAQRVQAMLSQTTEQQFGQVMARLADAANAAVTPLLGLASAALQGTIGALNFATHEEQEHPAVAGTLGVGAILGALYGTFRVGKGAIKVARNLLSRIIPGAAGAAEGAEGLEVAAAAAPEIAAVGGAAAGAAATVGAAPAAVAVGAGLTLGAVASWIDSKIPALRHLDDWTEGVLGRLNPFGGGGAAHPAASATGPGGPSAAAAGASNTTIHVNVGPITLNGVGTDIKPMVEKLFHEMADKLGQSLTHASTVGYGHMSSAFSIGGAP